MKERPILFSGAMVRAILAGTKTQTRRLVSKQLTAVHAPTAQFAPSHDDPHEVLFSSQDTAKAPHVMVPVRYHAGDRLWVKEAWQTSRACDDRAPSEMEVPGGGYGWPVWYAADNGEVTWRGAKAGGPGFTTPGKTRVSIHMPRWASRITLEITDVRVQRLQDISEADARAEGVDARMDSLRNKPDYDHNARLGAYPVTAFSRLWDSLNDKRAAWASNPWVWAITFKRVNGEVSR